MADAYTVLWKHDRCREMRAHGHLGTPLTRLYGGPHISEPSFVRAGVKVGDAIYPMRLVQGVLYLIACMRVGEVLTLEAYIARNPERFADVPPWRWPAATFENYIARHPEEHYLGPSCTDEVLLAAECTPMRLDLAVPPEVLERLRYRSRRGEREVKDIENGRLTRINSIWGVYRLAPSSAADFAAIMAGATDMARPRR